MAFSGISIALILDGTSMYVNIVVAAFFALPISGPN
jgi:hypothetical protein